MIRRFWLSLKRCFLLHSIRLFRIRGQDERVARGFALGMIVNFFPTFGFGVLVSGFIARALGGNGVAGLVGGATLTFAWPVLFFMNMKVGRLFVQSPVKVEDLEDVTEKSMNALMWGHTFMAGAVVNSILFGGLAYLLLRALHWRMRPAALAYFRHHAREYRHAALHARPRVPKARLAPKKYRLGEEKP
jgi:uncharacterized protein (DUF2062 family)